jgi:hypothetical protein
VNILYIFLFCSISFSFFPHFFITVQPIKSLTTTMTRGNQREKAREKNLKKQASEKKKLDGDPKKRMEAHAAIMREKQKLGM